MKKRFIPLRTAEKRAVTVFAVLCFMLSFAVWRTAYVQKTLPAPAASENNTRKILLSESRGAICDRSGLPLVNATSEKRSALIVCESTRNAAGDAVEALSGAERGDVAVVKGGITNTDGTAFEFSAVSRYGGGVLCPHLIGYVNADGEGVCGIEKAFDGILSAASGKLYARYTADASGKAIVGKGLTEINENYGSKAGVKLTVDRDIQTIAEQALKNSSITAGSVLVLDCRGFEILAAASVPAFDVNDPAASLESEDAPFIDRNFSAFPVGSVFKPFIAAAAMASGNRLSEVYDCSGSIPVGQHEFGCFNRTAHGGETLFEAIANSCNCFFIDLGLKTGAKAITDICRAFGFGEATELFPGCISAAGNLPAAEDVTNGAQLANLCFGQGELLATPLQIAAAYSVIANGGYYIEPCVLKELTGENGQPTAYYKSEKRRTVLDPEICGYIGDCLYNNVLSGTGMNGNPENVTAAGKTATAQTGQYDENKNERLCTWFAGFFPYDKPLYTVVVFNEKGSAASLDCAPVFKEIAEKMTENDARSLTGARQENQE